MNIPSFSEFWQLTTKVGRKELLAKKYLKLSDNRKLAVFKLVSDNKFKMDGDKILK